jgi:hypothetical protein
MNISQNKSGLRKEQKIKRIAGYRQAVARLNTIDERLFEYEYTPRENDALLSERRALMIRIEKLEHELIHDFGVNTENL